MNLDDFITALKGVGFIVLVLVCVGGTLILGINYAEKRICTNYQIVSGKETQYAFFGGCYVKTNNDWFTMEQYQSVLVAKEGLRHIVD